MFSRLAEHPAVLLVLILLIVCLFGYKRLPDVARSFGRSTRILKSEVEEMKSESAQRLDHDETPESHRSDSV